MDINGYLNIDFEDYFQCTNQWEVTNKSTTLFGILTYLRKYLENSHWLNDWWLVEGPCVHQ